MKRFLFIIGVLASLSLSATNNPYSVRDWVQDSYRVGKVEFSHDSVNLNGVWFKVISLEDSSIESTLKRKYTLSNGLEVCYFVHYYGHEAITVGDKVIFGPPWLTKQL